MSFDAPNKHGTDKAVQFQLQGHCYANLDPDSFFDTLLSGEGVHGDTIEATSASLLQSLKAEGWYADADGEKAAQWKGVPLKPPSEEGLFPPLLAVIRAITNKCYDVAGIGGEDPSRLVWSWMYEHYPPSRIKVGLPEIVSRASGYNWGNSDEEVVLWRRVVHTIVEVKKEITGTAALRMLQIARQCLIGQPDRRFLYGFVFAAANLQVWHIDRSGTLCPTQFSIHERPDLFVQAFVAMALKTPVSLGWDTSMKIFKEIDSAGRTVSVPSWEDKLPTGHGDDAGERRAKLVRSRKWHVSAGGQDYVLFDIVTLPCAEVLRGRATRVWRAWNVADMRGENAAHERPVYIAKDSWRDHSRGHAGDLHKHLAGIDGVARALWYGAVELANSDGKLQVDDTLNFIRRGIEMGSDTISIRLFRALEDIPGRPTDEDYKYLDSIRYWMPERFTQFHLARPPCNRVRTRLVMRDSGRPIYNFTTLHELFGAMRDAVAGLLKMHEKGVLHRNVSIDNILINSRKREGNVGFLIDLDSAALLNAHKPDVADEPRGTAAFMACEIAMGKQVSLDPQEDRAAADLDDSAMFMAPVPRKPRVIPPVVHSLSHDLESVFWVMVWLCLCCAGPARAREFAMDAELGRYARSDEAACMVTGLFERTDPEALGLVKSHALRLHYEWQDVEACVHPYLFPAVPLLRQLRRIVCGMLQSSGRGSDKAVEAGHEMIKWLNICATEPWYELYDQDAERGGAEQYNGYREAERKRRASLGWLPDAMQSPHTNPKDQPPNDSENRLAEDAS